MAKRPQKEDELQRREAIGVIRASRFVRRYTHDHKPISIQTVCDIHKEIFNEAWPEIAGAYRDENLEITDSKHLPPHHSTVRKHMEKAGIEFAAKLKKLERMEGALFASYSANEITLQGIDDIVLAAAWIHHLITYIHPFREGNGRTLRLFLDLLTVNIGFEGVDFKKISDEEFIDACRHGLVKDYQLMKGIYFKLLSKITKK